MAHRPDFIDLPPSMPFATPSPALPSPRRAHVAGDVPPAMSPLDAFAAQSRLLAKQLDDSRRNGRPVSRLPPLAVADTLSKTRVGYFRSTSVESARAQGGEGVLPMVPAHDGDYGSRMEIESPSFRPKSFYPTVSRVAATPNDRFPSPSPLGKDRVSTSNEDQPPSSHGDYFGAPRALSPESTTARRNSRDKSPHPIPQGSSYDSSLRRMELQRGMSLESTSSRGQYSNSLQPPNPPYARKTPSLRSVSSDDEHSGDTPRSSMSQHRKLSSSSAVSLPQSPLSPFASHHDRPPSVTSEYSVNGHRVSRPAFNFSRPLSRSSQPSMEFSRPSIESQNYSLSDELTPTAVPRELVAGTEDEDQQSAEPSSYIYAKFSLPRGRMVHRDSVPLESLMPNIEFDKKSASNNGPNGTPSTQPLDSSLPTPPHSIDSERGVPRVQERYSEDSRPIGPPRIPNSRLENRHSMTSMNSGSTIKGSQRTIGPSTELTAEEHLSKGIECHERGSLKESTYHLRIAARQNNATAMLLYALACRHGWGMRPNPSEGVQWLRKAMDSASIELEMDEEASSRGRTGDSEGRKTRRAQFALSVYELGVSHMNGWGIEQDKALALKCFEIASSWGDADAMAEAGFCYAQGVGCKKDLKKAAQYYRSAEAKGMSMVGNSWIYKPKYADDSSERKGRGATTSNPEKKPRDKSRTRTLFGRKKSVA